MRGGVQLASRTLAQKHMGRALAGDVLDEPELRAARHGDRLPRMMRQHKRGNVIRRLLSPPPFPAVIRPGAADRAEHVATQNPRANPGQSLRRDVIIDARLATCVAVHLLPGARGEEPVHQGEPPTPIGFSRSWFGPAPKPSIETAKLLTRSFGTALR